MTRTLSSFSSFRKNFKDRKPQTVYEWIVADQETPVSAYLKLCHHKPYSFLLESVEGGAVLGRYTAIGLEPDVIWRYQDNEVRLSSDGQKWTKEKEDPLSSLQKLLDDSKTADDDQDLPPMATPGLFGYLGYDMVRLIEDIPDQNPDTLDIPEGIMVRPSIMVIFDNVKHMVCLTTPVYVHAGNSAECDSDVYRKATARLEAVQTALKKPSAGNTNEYETALEAPLPVDSNTSEADYKKNVKKAIDYIYAGDIFQVVPSQRFSVPFDLPAFELYRTLRRLNPSPFLFYLDFDTFSLVGSSPEILVRVRDKTITIRPIAGTRKRGRDPDEDRTLSNDLLSDEKERAEHLMLLDLGRNDVGKVAETGSVKVTEQFTIEYYSHVMHIVSNIEGRLAKDKTTLEALFSGFPAGTVSGAPKIRAMEIIDELESAKRRFYGGCVGYLDSNGNIDTCIALRTALVKDSQIYVQAGGGVVADSDPQLEYEESRNKARAIIDAADQTIASARKNRRRQVLSSQRG